MIIFSFLCFLHQREARLEKRIGYHLGILVVFVSGCLVCFYGFREFFLVFHGLTNVHLGFRCHVTERTIFDESLVHFGGFTHGSVKRYQAPYSKSFAIQKSSGDFELAIEAFLVSIGGRIVFKKFLIFIESLFVFGHSLVTEPGKILSVGGIIRKWPLANQAFGGFDARFVVSLIVFFLSYLKLFHGPIAHPVTCISWSFVAPALSWSKDKRGRTALSQATHHQQDHKERSPVFKHAFEKIEKPSRQVKRRTFRFIRS